MSNSNTKYANSIIECSSNAIKEAGYKDRSTNSPKSSPTYINVLKKTVPVAEGSSETTIERYMENYKNVSQDIRDQMNAEAEAVQIILTGIEYAISTPQVEACPMHVKCGKPLQGHVQFYTYQLQPEWQRFRDTCYPESRAADCLGLSQALYILKTTPNEIARQSNQNRGKALVTSSAPTYDPEPATVTEDDEMSKEKEIDKLMALISLSFHKAKNDYCVNKRKLGFQLNARNKLIGEEDTDPWKINNPDNLNSSNDIYQTEQGDFKIPIDSFRIDVDDRAQEEPG
ncbi:hypothetical protein Tco_0266920 [Tanacetum coccineum]